MPPKYPLFPPGPSRSQTESTFMAGRVSSVPTTPLFSRSISSNFGSPSAYRPEQEETVIYELGARHLSAGFAGENRPRCVYFFDPENARRLGDYRAYDPNYQRKRRKLRDENAWGEEHELYRTELRGLDLGLIEDKLERAIRMITIDHLQLDLKARKAVLVIPSLLPTPLIELTLKVLFNYSTLTPSVVLLTTPFLACVAGGVRNGLVVEVGWEEAVVTAVGEYKEVFQRRSVRAGKVLTRAMAKVLEEEMAKQLAESERSEVEFCHAEEVTKRMAWCRPRSQRLLESEQEPNNTVKIPVDDCNNQRHINMPFQRLSEPAETAFFTQSDSRGDDDHNLPLPELLYRVLLVLPSDLRALCISRIIITGGVSALPGLKQRLLQELTHLIDTRGWNPIHNYGSATLSRERALKERSANIALPKEHNELEPPLSPTKKPIQESIPHRDRIHDDKYDAYTLKAEREANRGKIEMVKGVVRGVETLGAWAGASLVVSLKVKAVHNVEREEFLKHGLLDGRILI